MSTRVKVFIVSWLIVEMACTAGGGIAAINHNRPVDWVIGALAGICAGLPIGGVASI